MAYRVSRHDRTMQAALRRIAGSQVAAAIAAVDDPAGRSADTVHTVRRACKKVRALLRLVRPGFDDYRAENAAFRNIARGVSTLRDADMRIATFDALRARHAGEIDAAAFAALRDHLLALHAADQDAAGEAPDPVRQLARCRADLEAAGARCAQWSLEEDGFAALRGGLRRSFAQARKAMRDAHASASDETFHDWRKRAKDHWYHARLLQPIWPGPMRAHVRCADELGEALGQHHDLAVLVSAVRRHADDDAAVDTLVRLAHARQEALAATALAIGTRLFAQRPKALVRSWGTCFKAWRAGH